MAANEGTPVFLTPRPTDHSPRSALLILSAHGQRLFSRGCVACQQGQPWLCCRYDALRHHLGKGGAIKNKFPVIHLGLLEMGASSLLCGLLPAEMVWLWVFAALCALLGSSGNLYNIPYIAYMQEAVAPERVGRAPSPIGSLSSAAMPLGLLIAGPIAESRGVPLWFFVSGAVLLLLAFTSALLILPYRQKVADP